MKFKKAKELSEALTALRAQMVREKDRDGIAVSPLVLWANVDALASIVDKMLEEHKGDDVRIEISRFK